MAGASSVCCGREWRDLKWHSRSASIATNLRLVISTCYRTGSCKSSSAASRAHEDSSMTPKRPVAQNGPGLLPGIFERSSEVCVDLARSCGACLSLGLAGPPHLTGPCTDLRRKMGLTASLRWLDMTLASGGRHVLHSLLYGTKGLKS